MRGDAPYGTIALVEAKDPGTIGRLIMSNLQAALGVEEDRPLCRRMVPKRSAAHSERSSTARFTSVRTMTPVAPLG